MSQKIERSAADPSSGGPAWHELPRLSRVFGEKAGANDRVGAFAFENYKLLHEHGFLALPIARQFGGYGGGLLDHVRLLDQVAQGDASTALVLSMYLNQHAAQARIKSWPRRLYEEIARKSLEAPSLINALNYEPELGSPVRGTGVLGTVAVKVPGGWRISGHKRYATGSVGLRWFTVAARNENNVQGNWLVEADSPGISIIEHWNHLGLRGTASHDVILDNVFVPDGLLTELFDIRKERSSNVMKSWGVASWNAIYLGVAKAARNFLVTYLEGRAPGSLGFPLAQLPHVRDRVGRIEIMICAAERINLSIAKDFDLAPGSVSELDAGASKQIIRDYAIEVVQLAVTTMGNAGLSREYPLERYFRDVQFGPNHPPGRDVINSLAADHAFGHAQTGGGASRERVRVAGPIQE